MVGNSLGGAVALGLTLRNPDRIEKLILMAPGGIESREDYFSMPGIQAMVKYPMASVRKPKSGWNTPNIV